MSALLLLLLLPGSVGSVPELSPADSTMVTAAQPTIISTASLEASSAAVQCCRPMSVASVMAYTTVTVTVAASSSAIAAHFHQGRRRKIRGARYRAPATARDCAAWANSPPTPFIACVQPDAYLFRIFLA